MRKKIAGIPLYLFVASLLCCLAAIVVGTFWDLPISEAFVSIGNPFGKAFAILGKYPGYALIGLSGVLFFISRKDKKSPINVVVSWVFLLALGLGAGALYGYDDVHEYVDNIVFSVLIGLAAIIPFEVLFYFLFRKANKEEAFHASMAILFVGFLTIAVSYLLKTSALRPRYYWLADNHLSFFQTWYAFSPAAHDANIGAPDSAFESWPSAHAALASITFVSILFPRLNAKFAGKQIIFFVCSFAWTVLVSVARVSDGSHFLSDVGWGALLGFLISLVVLFLVYHSSKAEVEQPVSVSSPSNPTAPEQANETVKPADKPDSGNAKKKAKGKDFEIDL